MSKFYCVVSFSLFLSLLLLRDDDDNADNDDRIYG